MRFTNGLKDGLPIALGYVSVAFAYAISAMSAGFPAWFPVLVSFTNFTGTGQFAGTNLIAAGAGVLPVVKVSVILQPKIFFPRLTIFNFAGIMIGKHNFGEGRK